MNPKTVQLLSGTVFGLITLAHVVRVFMDVPVTIGGLDVPEWASVAAVFAMGTLAAANFAVARRP